LKLKALQSFNKSYETLRTFVRFDPESVEIRLTAGIERRTEVPMLIMGETVLLGAIVLEGMDLLVDCARQQLVPNVGTLYQPVFRV
jgi:hypothetical protein